MPGMPVYQDSPSNLKNQIYAANAGNVINVKADDTGRLTVSTDAAAPLDVSVTQATDSISVYGNDGTTNRILKTNATGQMDIRPLTSADEVSVVITEASDSISVYGNDGTANRILKTNATGQMDVRPLTAADVVTAVVSQADDSIAVYGNDGTTNRVLKTNATGQMDVRPLTAADVVTAVVSQTDDSIAVYGNDGTTNRVLKTDANGVLSVNTTYSFVDTTLVDADATTNAYQYTAAQDISGKTSYAFFVKNSDVANSATIVVQLSPNNTDWVDDTTEAVILAGGMTITTSNKFLKYIRVAYKSTVADAAAEVSIIYQAQG
ncbi:MAG: DUF6385 domain-containing protein [Cellulosilyticaceae bacterium]